MTSVTPFFIVRAALVIPGAQLNFPTFIRGGGVVTDGDELGVCHRPKCAQTIANDLH
jgi:hypothetical protein